MLGNVFKINKDRGFAFVAGDDKRDYFIHWSELQRASIAFRNLEVGMRLEFTVKENEDKNKAPRGEKVTWTGQTVPVIEENRVAIN